jgi:hypothetical protein
MEPGVRICTSPDPNRDHSEKLSVRHQAHHAHVTHADTRPSVAMEYTLLGQNGEAICMTQRQRMVYGS